MGAQAWTKAVMRRAAPRAFEHTPPLAKRPSGAINQPERAQRACSHDVEKAASAMDGSGSRQHAPNTAEYRALAARNPGAPRPASQAEREGQRERTLLPRRLEVPSRGGSIAVGLHATCPRPDQVHLRFWRCPHRAARQRIPATSGGAARLIVVSACAHRAGQP